VALTYKGESSFKTVLGAFTTLLVLITMLAFTTYRCLVFVTKDDPEVSTQNFMRDLDTADLFYPGKYGFNIGFGLGKPLS
jgi:hypothetical protein